jgi:DNA-binding XRE family transcriptional regulator
MAKPFRNLKEQVLARPGARAQVEEYGRAIDAALRLAELRAQRGLTQQDLANALNVSQRRVSALEHQSDLYLSTLKGYIEMLGGKLEIVASFPDRRVKLEV